MNQQTFEKKLNKITRNNDVLRVISKINRLSVTINDVKKLIEEVIKLLIDIPWTENVWGITLDSNKKIKFHHCSDLDNDELIKNISQSIYPDCIKYLLDKNELFSATQEFCSSCVFNKNKSGMNGYSIAIKNENQIFGVIVFYMTLEFSEDFESIKLLKDLANDIGFAVNHINARKENEISQKKLLESEEKYREMYNNTPAGIFRTTLDGKGVALNMEMAKILKFNSKEEALKYYQNIGQQLYLDPSKREEFKQLLMKSGEVNNFQYQAKRKDGTIIWLSMNAKVNRNKNLIDGFCWDITKQKKLQSELKKNEENLRTTINSIGDGVIVTDKDSKIVNINNIAQLLTGYEFNDAIGRSLSEVFNIVNAHTREICQNPVKRVLKTGKIVGLANHTVLISKSKKEYQIADSAAPIKNDSGHTTGVVLVFRDVTKEYHLQEQLLYNRKQLQFIIDGGNIGTYLWYIQSGETIFNDRWAEILGYNLDELEPTNVKTWEKLTHPEDLKKAEEQIEKLFKKEIESYNIEIRMLHKDGHWVWVLDRGKVSQWDMYGNPLVMSGIHTDISQLKKSEELLIESEQNYKSIFSNMMNAFALHEIVIDENGDPIDYRFIEVNATFEKMVGLKQSDITGKLVTEVIPGIEKDPVNWIGKYGQVALNGKELRFENYVDSLNKWYRIYAYSPQKNHFATIFEDITDQKESELKLINSEKRFREIIKFNAIPMVLTDENQDILYFNDKFIEVFGYTLDDIQTAKKWWASVYPDPEYQEIVVSEWNAAVESAKRENREIKPQKWRVVCKDGTEKIAEYYFRSLGDINVVSMKDITDIERSQKNLKSIHEIYQKTIENAESVPYKLNYIDETYDYMSDKCEDLLGIKKEQITLEKIRKMVRNPIVTDNISATDYQEYNALFKSGKIDKYNTEFQIETPNDGLKWISDRSLTIKENGIVVGSMGILQDITELKISEQALRKSEERFKLAIDGTKDGLWDWNLETNYAYHSEQYATMLGYEYGDLPFSNEVWLDLIHPEDKAMANKKVQDYLSHKEQIYVSTFRMQCKDGTYKWITGRGKALFDKDGKAYRFVGFNTDITEEKKTEETKILLEKQIRKSQKLETLGTLAGGIAHDFNNILTPIMGYSDMAKNKLTKDDQFYEIFDEIFHASLRARDLIYQMLNFSRQSEHQSTPMDIAPVLKEALKLIRPSIPSTIEIIQNIDSKGKHILGDPTKIHQVIMNLCTNAYQAMGEKGGELFIQLSPVSIDKETSKQYLDLNSGEYLKLIIGDTGVGMDSNTLERIFEPFFTTKEVNQGTGLGLAVVHGIIQSHNGAISVYSEIGKGSTFNIFLPIVDENLHDESPLEKIELQLGSESILIVDDKISVTKILSKMLSGLGYETTVINSSIDGLELFKNNQEKFQLVITDLTMPNMTGLEFAEKLHEIKEDIPVIMVTGYGNRVKLEDLEKARIDKLIGKPILMNDISIAVREIFDKIKKE